MSWKAAIAWVVLFVLLAWTSVRVLDDDSEQQPLPGAFDATVTRVVDGDTVKIGRSSGKQSTIRYIGVDTPESVKPDTPVQCFAKAASDFNKQLVQGKRVRLRIGRERNDRYGRLLAYVYLADRRHTFVNAELIRRGYAHTLAIAPNTQFAGLFARLQRRAKRLDVGLWRACAS